MRLFILLLCFLINFAGQREIDSELTRLRFQGKPDLNLIEQGQLMLRGWRDRRAGEFDPPVSKTSRPADYVDGGHRGTLEFDSRFRNYSLHTVKVPSGTVFDGNVMGGCNFTQITPNTEAFDRTPGVYGHNLTFRNCNLANVKTYPDWTIENCNTMQVWMVGDIDSEGTYNVEDTQFISSSSQSLPVSPVKPLRALE